MDDQEANGGVMPFFDMLNETFFCVTYSGACPQYENQYMISVYDQLLPQVLRYTEGCCALFRVVSIQPVLGNATRVFITEVDFDITDETLVREMSPVPEMYMNNGAHVLMYEERPHPTGPLRLGRLYQGLLMTSHSKGKIKEIRRKLRKAQLLSE
jgi:hypothetical protein